MRRILGALAALTVLLVAVLPLRAQDRVPGPAMLVADRVFLNGRDTVVAEGNVEALRDGARLRAGRIVYDRSTGQLDIAGPITLTERTGRVVVVADSAALDDELRNGLIRGARVILDQQVQLAAGQVNRVNARYSQLYKATLSSCQVCNDGRPPLWQIRARRVVHDQDEQQLYFEDARFEVFGLPIAWVPRLRIPDPSLDRATGFLAPSLRQNSRVGYGVRVPYFIRLGDHRDLTLTPLLSNRSRTLEFRYRQAFRTGDVHVSGAISDDDLRPGDLRAYLEGGGRFDLPRDFVLTFDVELTSDDAYPTEYDYSEKDRLDSEISVYRVKRDSFFRTALTHYKTLRVDEVDANIPSVIGDITYERRFFPGLAGGELRLGAEAHGHYRRSDSGVDGPDIDRIVDGRDVTRLTADAAWLRSWTPLGGLRTTAELGVAFDSFRTAQDLTLPASATGVAPRAGLTLRYPLRRVASGGAVHIVEPVAQLAWTGGSQLAVANDESTRVEFDEGNLLDLSRFAGPDRRERGMRAAVGVNWSRFSPRGWSHRLTLGQVVRQDADPDFHLSSGLSGRSSDLLIAGQIRAPEGLALTGRAIVRNRSDLTKAEARASWLNPRLALGASYLWLDDDPQESRTRRISEWNIDGTLKLSRNWLGSANWRYDLVADSTAEAGFGVTYINECIEVDFSASRRFTSSTIVSPSTEFGFTVNLRGFSGEADGQRFARSCK